MMMMMMMVSGLPGAESGQAAGARGEDHGAGDRDQEAADGSLQVQVHHAQQRGQGQLLCAEENGIILSHSLHLVFTNLKLSVVIVSAF